MFHEVIVLNSCVEICRFETRIRQLFTMFNNARVTIAHIISRVRYKFYLTSSAHVNFINVLLRRGARKWIIWNPVKPSAFRKA